MSDMRDEMIRTLDRIVEDTVTQKLREACDGRAAEGGAMAAGAHVAILATPLWKALEAAGITGLGASDDVSFADAMALVRRAGYHALPVPLGEAIVARRLLARHGVEAPAGATTICSSLGRLPALDQRGQPTGRAHDVAWGGDLLLALVPFEGGTLALLDTTTAAKIEGTNMAGEPRTAVDMAGAKVIASIGDRHAADELAADGALLRAVQMAGAIEATLGHCLTWANDRVQFGKAIAKHQAVQHLLAQLAEEQAAAGAAVDLAIEASADKPDRFAIAVAKARAGEAAGKACTIAHAAFGAMGFTREHILHYSTRRLWSWRNEFGGEAYWQGELGRTVAAAGGDELWSLITAHG